MTGYSSDFFILPMSKPIIKEGDAWPKDAMVAAYWYIATTDRKADANMIESTVNKRGIDVPVLVNLKDIDAYTPLLWYKGADKAKAFCVPGMLLGKAKGKSAPPATNAGMTAAKKAKLA